MGDVLYIPKKYVSGYEGTTRVKRVTAKQAEVESGMKVYREVKDGRVRNVGYSSYGVNTYLLESAETKAAYGNQLAVALVKKTLENLPMQFDFRSLSTEELNEFNEGLKNIIKKYSK